MVSMGALIEWVAKGVLRKPEKAPYATDKPNLYRNCTSYYGIDGNNEIVDLIGDPTGEPFVVRVSGSGYIPLNAMIFAVSEDDARKRVMDFLLRARVTYRAGVEQYRANGDRNERYNFESKLERANAVIALAERRIEVEPFDKRYVTKASWGGDWFV